MSRLGLPRAPVNVIWFDDTDSTNLLAARLLASWQAGDDEPFPETLLVAGSQHAGQGRGENRWESPAGGIYVTWVSRQPVEVLPLVPQAVGVTLAEAAEALVPSLRVGLKWPNDLQVEGRKLGGILCQSRISGGSAWLIVGFGINCTALPDLGAEAPVVPTALRQHGYTGNALEALGAILGGFVERVRALLDRAAETRAAWEARSVHRAGDAMLVRAGGEEVSGRFRGFGPEGQLLVEVRGVERGFAAAELIVPLPESGG